MGKNLLITLCIIFALLCIILVYLSAPEDAEEPVVSLEVSKNITAKTDSDGDGAPDWLEEITNTDSLEASSFPYQRDIALAKNINVDDLLYGGPGEFTEEIVRKFLIEGDASSVSEEEKEKFVETSVDYFLRRIDQRGLPEITLSTDNTIPKNEILVGFLSSIKEMSDERQSIDILVNEIFAKNTSILPKAERMRYACSYALENIPRKVPAEIYNDYYLIVERITYSCEALSVSLTSNNTENFFYALHLLSSGRLLENSSGEEIQKNFIDAASRVVKYLQRG